MIWEQVLHILNRNLHNAAGTGDSLAKSGSASERRPMEPHEIEKQRS